MESNEKYEVIEASESEEKYYGKVVSDRGIETFSLWSGPHLESLLYEVRLGLFQTTIVSLGAILASYLMSRPLARSSGLNQKLALAAHFAH